MKSTLYLTAKVLPGNKIEIQTPNLIEGQTVEVVIINSEPKNVASDVSENESLSLEQRRAFLKLPLAERRLILETQAEKRLSHYQENSEWQELMTGDIIDY